MGTSVDSLLSTTELRNAVFRLNVQEGLTPRRKLLEDVCCRVSSRSSDLRIVGEALTTCWRDKQYSGSQLSEWRTCIIQAAERPTSLSKEMPEVFLVYTQLAAKAGKWFIQIANEDAQRYSPRDSPSERPKAVMRLASTIFEATAEASVSSASSTVFEGPLASPLESLISSSFELVRVLHVSTMGKTSQQPAEDDLLRRCCQELLSSTSRLVHIFRRQVPGKISETGGPVLKDRTGSRWLQLPTSLRVVAISIQSFTELGKLAISGAEISLALLSVSWKSIMSLLQVEEGRDAVASVVDVQSIIATLITSGVQTLKRAFETWLKQPSNSGEYGEKEARKFCIPIKFFFMTAGKISACYPQKAAMASRSMVSCASKVYGCLLQKDLIAHRAVTEVFGDLVVPSAFVLVHNLLNGLSVGEDQKIQIVRYITADELESSQTITDLDGCDGGNDIVDELFCNKPGGLLKTGRVALFLSVLRASCTYSIALLPKLLSRLQWLLDAIPEEEAYLLMTRRVFLPDDRSEASGKSRWQLMFPWVSHSVEIFAAVAARQAPIWTEFSYFLFNQVLHPSVICGELVLDVWCFIIRQSDSRLAEDHLNSLSSLFGGLVSSKAEASLQRRLARALCVLLRAAPESVVARVSGNVVQEDPFKSPMSAGMIIQLLQEGFPLRKPLWDRLLSSCIACGKRLVGSVKLDSRGLESPLAAQKPALKCLPLLLSQSACRGGSGEEKYLEEIKQIVLKLISLYTLDRNNSRMFHNHGIIGPTLELIPHVLHLLDPAVFQALLPRLLECCQTSVQTSSVGKELKQSLPEFLANLSEVAMQEDEKNPAMRALWGLYHLVLKEQPWALMHMGLQSFAHFAAHTSCQELWRFVPQDAAVVSTGNAEDDDSFMKALKVFIEKECAILSLEDVSGTELHLLRAESNLQQQKHKAILAALRKHSSIKPSGTGLTPPGRSEIQEAMAMLSKGIRVLKSRAPHVFKGRASQEWEAFRARLAEMNEEIKALQRRPQ